MLKSIVVTAALGAIFLAASAGAEELFPTTDRLETGWGLGLGMLYENEGYVDGDAEADFLPVPFYRGERFRWLGPQAEYRLWRKAGWSVSLRGEYRFDGYDPEEENNAIFEGMDERKSSLHYGVEIKHEAAGGHLTAEALKSASASKGVRTSVYYAYPFSAGAWTLMPKFGIERYDARFTNYYYGVRKEEATNARAFYEADASVNIDTGMDFQRDIGAHTFVGSIKYRRFGSSIEDSPLMDSKGSPRATFAYIYRF